MKIYMVSLLHRATINYLYKLSGKRLSGKRLSGKVIVRERSCPGNVLYGKVIVQETSVKREKEGSALARYIFVADGLVIILKVGSGSIPK